MAPAGNICAVSALLLCQAINLKFLDGSSRGILPASTLLLLLNPVPRLGFSPTTRYGPVALTVICSIGGAALGQAWARASGPHLPNATWSWLGSAWDFVIVLCGFPSQVLWCQHLWSLRSKAAFPVLCALPLNAVPLLLGFAPAVRDHGALGLVGGVLHHYSAHRHRHIGQKVI